MIHERISHSPASLWALVDGRAGIGRETFDDYFAGAKLGHGLVLEVTERLHQPVPLSVLRSRRPGFNPPQSFCYQQSATQLLMAPMETEVG